MVARIAARQHGVVRLDQLAWAGLSPTQVKRRLNAGHLHRLYRGVYAVGHTDISKEGRWIAAVFACGPKAVLSHGSAAHLWSLSPACLPFAHVTIPESGSRTKRKGIVLHRSSSLGPRDTTLRHRIPVTTPERTKRDMGWTKERTRSDLERAFLRLLRAHGLPLPEVNVTLGPHEDDVLWRERRLVVELDGYAYHSSRASFAADRRRDRELQRRGFVVLRFTYQEITDEPDAVASALLAHLARRAA